MPWKEYILATALVAHVGAAAILPSDYSYELDEPTTEYEQQIVDIEKLKVESLENLDEILENTKSIIKDNLENKNHKKEAKKLLEYESYVKYTDRPIPTPEEQLAQLKAEYSAELEEIHKLNTDAKHMEYHYNDIRDKESKLSTIRSQPDSFPNTNRQIKYLENSLEESHDAFVHEYNIQHKQAPERMKELRERAESMEAELKPMETRIKELEQEIPPPPKEQQQERDTYSSYSR